MHKNESEASAISDGELLKYNKKTGKLFADITKKKSSALQS